VPSGDDDAEQLASGSAESQVSPTVVDPGTTVTETPAGDPISVQACGDTPAAVHPDREDGADRRRHQHARTPPQRHPAMVTRIGPPVSVVGVSSHHSG
jgi:hypothetical protein